MVGTGAPRSSMFARGSPKFSRMLASAPLSASKKKKTTCSPKVKQRAYWNHELEKSLVDILINHKDCRGDNGWSSEAWNKMVKEFHKRNTYVSFNKNQIQEKEGQLKRDYKMLKAARGQSRSSWNERRFMVEGPPHLWDNLEISFPKIKKFHNAKASFPLYDACGELYDGHLAEGTYNITSLEAAEEPLRQIHDVDDIEDLEEEDGSAASVGRTAAVADVDDIEDLEEEDGSAASVGRTAAAFASGERRGVQRSTATTSAEPKEAKKGRKNSNVESIMERYLEMRTKQAEDERAQLEKEKEQELAKEKEQELAKEKEQAKGDEFSVKRCVAVLNTMDVTKSEKAKAYAVFKSDINREIFLSACSEDEEAALIWLRSEMA